LVLLGTQRCSHFRRPVSIYHSHVCCPDAAHVAYHKKPRGCIALAPTVRGESCFPGPEPLGTMVASNRSFPDITTRTIPYWTVKGSFAQVRRFHCLGLLAESPISFALLGNEVACLIATKAAPYDLVSAHLAVWGRKVDGGETWFCLV